MNSSAIIVALCLLILVPGVLFAVFWYYITKRGWGSRWLLATSSTVLISLLVIVLWWSARDTSILVLGLGFSVLSGIVFFIFLKTSPLSNALIGQNQQMPTDWASQSEEERNTRKQSAKLAIRDTLVVRLLQYIPLIIGVAILFLSRGTPSKVITSLAFFIMGFTGIVGIVLRPKYSAFQLYSPKSRMIGDVIVTMFAWSLALYNIFTR